LPSEMVVILTPVSYQPSHHRVAKRLSGVVCGSALPTAFVIQTFLASFPGISSGFIEKRYVGIAGMNFTRMGNTLWNVVTVAFCVCLLFPVDYHFGLAFEYKTDLCGVGMLGQIHVICKFHKYYLMIV